MIAMKEKEECEGGVDSIFNCFCFPITGVDVQVQASVGVQLKTSFLCCSSLPPAGLLPPHCAPGPGMTVPPDGPHTTESLCAARHQLEMGRPDRKLRLLPTTGRHGGTQHPHHETTF